MFDDQINKIIKNSATLKEINQNLNYKTTAHQSFINEWRNVKSLLNDNLFKIMLKNNFMDEVTFSKCLNPEKNMIVDINYKWINDFKSIVRKFDFNNFDRENPTNNIYLPFLNYAKITNESYFT